jgi:hypothetical protein
MFGGAISNNTATYSGGGVYNYPDGKFSLSENGVISNNKAAIQYSNIYSHNGIYELPDGNGELPDEHGVPFNIRLIIIALVILMVSIVVVFFFYFRKKRLSREKMMIL